MKSHTIDVAIGILAGLVVQVAFGLLISAFTRDWTAYVLLGGAAIICGPVAFVVYRISELNTAVRKRTTSGV